MEVWRIWIERERLKSVLDMINPSKADMLTAQEQD